MVIKNKKSVRRYGSWWQVILIGLIGFFLSSYLSPLYEDFKSEPISEKMKKICNQLSKEQNENQNEIWLPKSKNYIQSRIRYFKQTSLRPGCVVIPKTEKGLQRIMKLIGKERISFGISSGQHHSNIGFSSTLGGLQIDMRGFKKIKLSEDKSYIDLGTGLKWIEVYKYLQGSGRQVIGGRTMTVGVGGFLAGGGGMGWSTNEFGMTSNSAIEAELITPKGEIKTVSRLKEPDLFWALRGGGNKFGIVTRWRLETHTQSEKIYGGMRIYPISRKDKLNQALINFLSNNTDSGAQIIQSYVVAFKLIGMICIQVYYPNENPGEIFEEFNYDKVGKPWKDGWGSMTYIDTISASMTEQNANQRSLMDEQNFEHFQSKEILDKAAELTIRYGKQWFIKGRWLPLSHSVYSMSFEPFQPGWGKPYKETQGVYPYDNSPMPLIALFYWKYKRDDEFFKNSARLILTELKQIAINEGQKLDQFHSYPNYAQSDRTPIELYGKENWNKLKELRKVYDPENVMGLTNYFFD